MNHPVQNDYCCRSCEQTSGREHGQECQRLYDNISRWLPILQEYDQHERQLLIDSWQDEIKAAEEAEEEAELEGLSEDCVNIIKKMRLLAEPFVRLIKREQKKVNSSWDAKVAKERKLLKKWE